MVCLSETKTQKSWNRKKQADFEFKFEKSDCFLLEHNFQAPKFTLKIAVAEGDGIEQKVAVARLPWTVRAELLSVFSKIFENCCSLSVIIISKFKWRVSLSLSLSETTEFPSGVAHRSVGAPMDSTLGFTLASTASNRQTASFKNWESVTELHA